MERQTQRTRRHQPINKQTNSKSGNCHFYRLQSQNKNTHAHAQFSKSFSCFRSFDGQKMCDEANVALYFRIQMERYIPK